MFDMQKRERKGKNENFSFYSKKSCEQNLFLHANIEEERAFLGLNMHF